MPRADNGCRIWIYVVSGCGFRHFIVTAEKEHRFSWEKIIMSHIAARRHFRSQAK